MPAWSVHIGAHKTATTHLQFTLDALAEELATQGVQIVPLQPLRDHKFPREVIRASAWRPLVSDRLMHAKTAALFREDLSARRLVVSDENILGDIASLFSDRYYPDAVRRLRFLRSTLGFRDVTLFVSIRRHDAIAASAYVELLRARPVDVRFADVVERFAATPPSWLELLERIHAELPGARLRVWRFEDYIRDPLPVLTELLDHSPSLIPPIENPSQTRSPSAEAIASIEALDRGVDRSIYQQRVAEAIKSTQGGTKFSPFDPSATERLAAAYAEDITAISRRFPDAFIQFDQ